MLDGLNCTEEGSKCVEVETRGKEVPEKPSNLPVKKASGMARMLLKHMSVGAHVREICP